MIRSLVEKFIPKNIQELEEQLPQAKMFIVTNILFIFVTLAIGITLLAMGENQDSYDVFSVFAIEIVSCLLFLKTRSIFIGGNILIFALFWGLAKSFYLHGLLSISLIWLILTLGIANYILDKKSSKAWNSIFLITLVCIYILQKLHLLTPVAEHWSIEKLDSIFASSIIAVMTTWYTSINHHKFREQYAEITNKQKQQLATTLFELQHTQESLNDKLNENSTLVKLLVHDISNPVSIIRVTLHSLSRYSQDELPKVIPEQIQKLNRATSNIMDILKHIRELQVISSGKKQIGLQPVSIDDALEEAKFTFKHKMEQKNIHIQINKNITEKYAIVVAEPISFSNHVVNNLISNAIKFSYPGSEITINITEEGLNYILEIKDTGIGIPEEIRNNIFRVDKPTSRHGTEGEVGSGFGMPLVKYYLDLYKAQIEISSTPIEADEKNHGTSFKILLKKHIKNTVSRKTA